MAVARVRARAEKVKGKLVEGKERGKNKLMWH